MDRNKTRYLGQWGEALAAQWLFRQGYALLDHHFTCREGELDLTARKGDLLVLVEVKLRTGSYMTGAESVTPRKQARLRAAAARYLEAHPEFSSCYVRFDVCQIDAPEGVETPAPQITWLENAFY